MSDDTKAAPIDATTHERHSIAATFKRRAAVAAIHREAHIVAEFGAWCTDFREYIAEALEAYKAVPPTSDAEERCAYVFGKSPLDRGVPGTACGIRRGSPHPRTHAFVAAPSEARCDLSKARTAAEAIAEFRSDPENERLFLEAQKKGDL